MLITNDFFIPKDPDEPHKLHVPHELHASHIAMKNSLRESCGG